MPEPSGAVSLAATAVAIVGVDQLSKSIIVDAIGPGRDTARIALGTGWAAIEYAENSGAAFGLFSNLTPVLAVVSAAVLVGVLIHFFRTPNPTLLGAVSVGAIAGGALGNLLDRIRLGYVVDFVAIGPWPNFNVADSAITLGVLGLAWGWVRPNGDDLESDAH